MEKTTLENIGQYTAYSIIILIAAIKTFSTAYKWLKEIFKKDKNKEKEKDKSDVIVNVNPNPFEKFSNKEDYKDDYRYFLYFLLEQGKILRAMHDMKSDILKEQMEYFNKNIANFRMVVIQIVLDLIKETGVKEEFYSTYFCNFENFLEVCESKTIETFRQMCKDNHFSEYSNIEFRELCNKDISIILGNLGELIRKRFLQKELIRNFNKIYTLKADLQKSLIDCFEYAREVSINREQKVKQAKECFENQISEIIGIKYSLEI